MVNHQPEKIEPVSSSAGAPDHQKKMESTATSHTPFLFPGPIRQANVPQLIRYAITDWCVIACMWSLIILLPIGFYPIALVIIAGRFHALGVILHDACHLKKTRPDKRLVAVLEVISAYPISTTLNAMRYHHLRHHRKPCTLTDPYFKPGITTNAAKRLLVYAQGFFLVPAWIVRSFYGSAAIYFPGMRNSYGRIFLGDRSGSDLASQKELIGCLKSEPRQVIFFICVFALLWRFPHAVFFGYLFPLILAGALNAYRVAVEHVHVFCPTRSLSSVITATVTHDYGWFGKLFLFPRNIGFHTAHHLYPTASLESLPALQMWQDHNAVVNMAAKPQAPDPEKEKP
jgi:fatty acid desaturase